MNVHGLRDLNNEEEPNTAAFPQMFGQPGGGGGSTDIKCLDMFLPGFSWKLFITIISILQSSAYLVSCAVNSRGMRPANTLGASYGPWIQKGEVWRPSKNPRK
eukprot:GHVP01038717.1.p1 GENE.GHVP01038717.1~~GHVP01038717.1.p1  ORF type:complete len:103 (-),score=17.18 GHVP01038717.1:7-315(-)